MKYARMSARTVHNVKTRDYLILIRAQFSLLFGSKLSECLWYPHWRMQENRLGKILSSKIIQQRLLLGMIILNSQTSYLIAKMNIWIKTLEFTLWSINNGAKLQLSWVYSAKNSPLAASVMSRFFKRLPLYDVVYIWCVVI